MFEVLKKLLGIRTTNHDRKHAETPLFSGSAYFSNRVPRAFTETWAHGGEISSGTDLDARARYFFAMDPSEPWVVKLFAKSVMVVHAGWIAHCADQAFQVPITKYILDDQFVPAPPYKLTDNLPQIYVPLSDPTEPVETEFGFAAASDTPSTPTSMPRKRKREQAYFDSPSGSLVFSGFDKDGMPRRPRKQHKLRFDPSFSPGEGRYSREPKEGRGLNLLGSPLDTVGDGAEIRRDETTGTLCGPSDGAGVRCPETPDKPLIYVEPSGPYRCLAVDDLPKPIHASSPAAACVHMKNEMPPVRVIDFINLPPRTRRGRLSAADNMKSAETWALMSVMRPEHKARTPKKLTFANHARVCVYTVSPQRLDTKNPVRGCSGDKFRDGQGVDEEINPSTMKAEDPDDSTVGAITNVAPQTDILKSDDDDACPGIDRSQNKTVALTVDEVEDIRHHLLGVSGNISAEDGRLATLFELGKTFRGMTFRHVW